MEIWFSVVLPLTAQEHLPTTPLFSPSCRAAEPSLHSSGSSSARTCCSNRPHRFSWDLFNVLHMLCGFSLVLIGCRGDESVHICTSTAWLTCCSRDSSYPRCSGSMSRPFFNHVLQNGADKRCKGDYGSRRTSLWRGLRIMALHHVLTGGNKYISIQLDTSSGVTELVESFAHG